MAADSAKFVVEFQAEVSKLRKEIQSLKKDVGDFNKGDQRIKKEQKRYVADEQRRTRVDRRDKKRDQDQERKHVRLMAREKISLDRGSSRERIRAMEQEVRAFQRLAKRGPLPAHLDPDGRYNEQRQKPRRGGAGAFLMGAAGAAVVGAGGLVIGAARAGYERYMERQVAMGRSIGLGAPGQHNRDIIRGMRGAHGGRLGYSSIDTANMNPLMARATGVNGPGELMQATRARGLEGGEAADIFGAIRRAGFDFQPQGKQGSAGANQFKKLMAAGLESGLEKARFPEFAQGVMQIAEQARGALTGKIDTSKIASLLATWGATGRPGMQGAAGAALLGKVTGAITSPGGGEWGSAFMNQAMGFGKPGGNASFYQAEKRRETASTDPRVVSDVMKEFSKQFGGFGAGGGKEESALAMREALGVSLHQAEDLQNIYQSNKSSEDKQAEIEKIMQEAQPLEKQSLDEMKNIGGGVKRIAELTDRAVGIGAKFAPIIEKLEDLQYQVLKQILAVLDTMGGYMKELRDFFLKNQTATGKASGALDDAQSYRDQGRAARTSKSAMEAYKQEFLKEKSARDAAAAPMSYDASGVLEAATGAITGDTAKSVRQQVQLQEEAQRKALAAGGRYARAKRIQDQYGTTPLSKEMQQYIEAGGDAAVSAGSFDAMDVPAPPGMQRRKSKGTYVPPPASPAPSATGNGVGAHTGEPNSGTSKVHVIVEPARYKANDVPVTTVTGAGSNPDRGTR